MHRCDQSLAGAHRAVALVAPSAVPPAARVRLAQILNAIMSAADYAEFNKRFGLEYEPLTSRETQAFMDAELEHASVIARKAGISLNSELCPAFKRNLYGIAIGSETRSPG